jgi:hypothetical protein
LKQLQSNSCFNNNDTAYGKENNLYHIALR